MEKFWKGFEKAAASNDERVGSLEQTEKSFSKWYMGGKNNRYARGVRTMKRHLSGEKVENSDWDHLVLHNPSGSLLKHVHPEHRQEIASKYVEAHGRVFGPKK